MRTGPEPFLGDDTQVICCFRASSVTSEAIDDFDQIQDPSSITTKKRKTTSNLSKTKVEKGKGRLKTPPLSANFVSSVEWPEHFKRLQKTFQALNTVYTFLSTRKHLASTFDNLKSSVQTILKRWELFPDLPEST